MHDLVEALKPGKVNLVTKPQQDNKAPTASLTRFDQP